MNTRTAIVGHEPFTMILQRIAGRFRRREVRDRVARYLAGLLDPIERKNGWQLAEHLGEVGPRGVQRVLSGSQWNADGLRDDLRTMVLEHLGTPDGSLIVDETGFVKKGTKSAGVQRQYSGTAGRTENCQIGVFLAYGSSAGHAFLDRELYLPEGWFTDRARCREAGIPDETAFATKPALAIQMLERAFAAGVRAAWVLADEVYGNDEAFRRFLERQGQPYVLAVSSTQLVWQDMTQRTVAALVADLPAQTWATHAAGQGSKGERLYDWACLRLSYAAPPGMECRILARRNRTTAAELAYYRVFCPRDTPLAALAEAAGQRWMIEECFEEAKGTVGLDQYEVRRYDAWYRFITLAVLAHAILAVARVQAQVQEKKKGGTVTA